MFARLARRGSAPARALLVFFQVVAMALWALGPMPVRAVDQVSPAPTESTAPVDPTPTTDPTPTDPAASTDPATPAPTDPTPAATDPSTPAPSDASTPAPAPAAPVSLIVRFHSGVSAAEQDAVIAALGGEQTSAFAALGIRVISVPGDAASATVSAYLNDSSVASVEQDHVRSADAAPSDPGYAGQWNLTQIGWDVARDSVTPSGLGTVAVLDTGISAGATDVADNVVLGWSAFGTDPMSDPNGHGTAVASIAAAATDNATGIAGVGYAKVNLLSVQVLDANGTGTDSDIIAGVVWAADHGADVILMSFSNPGYSSALQSAIDYAWAKDVVVVAATGNDASSTPTYPAGDAHVMGVSSTDSSDALAASSNYGQDTFIAAPGENIPALATDGSVTTVSGTSAAAAQVAGAAALLHAIDAAPNDVIVARLAATTDPAGTADQTGNGRLNLGRAVSDTTATGIDPTGAPGGGPLVGPYVAAGNAASGDGTMVVSPTTTVASSTGNSFDFTFGAPNGKDFNPTGSQLTLVVPAGWTAPQSTTAGNAGYISIASSTCTSSSISGVSGTGPWTITVNMQCAGGTGFVLRYAGGGSKVTAPSSAGANTFTTKTKQNGGTLTNIATQPVVTVLNATTTTISNAATLASTPTAFGTNYSVSVSVTSGGGTPTGSVAVSDGTNSCTVTLASGAGSCSLPSNALGSKSITAHYNGTTSFAASDATPASHTVNPAATTTAVSSGTNPSVYGQSVTLTADVSSLVSAGSIAGGTVTFKDGGSSIGTSTTNAAGKATFSAAFTVIGSHTITAEFAGVGNYAASTGSGLTQTVNKGDSNAHINAGTLGTSTDVGVSYAVTGYVDAAPQAVGTPTGTVTVSDGTGASCVATIQPDGTWTCNLTSTSAGDKTISAHYGGDTNFNQDDSNTQAHQVLATAATHLSVTGLVNAVAGTVQSVTVTAQTASNTTATGYTGTVHFTSSDGQGLLPANYTFTVADAGVHTFTNGVTLKTSGSQTVTATDTVTASITGGQTVTISAAAATHFSVSAPASATAGSAFTVTVTALDAYNNTATGYIGTAHFTSSDGGATLPSDYTFVAGDNGAHTFTNGATLTIAGSQSITATDTITSSITGSTNVTVTHGAATKVVFTTDPTGTYTADDTISVVVTVQDAYGNTVDTGASATATIDLSLSGGSLGAVLGGTTSKAATAGVATFSNLTVHKVGTAYKLSAASTGLTGDDSTNFDITHGAATKVVFTTDPTGTYTADDTISVVVTVQDAYGNTVDTGASATATIDLSLSGGSLGAVLGGTTSKAATAGVATFSNLTVHKVGTAYKLSAASTGLTGDDSTTFDITHGAATKVVFTTDPNSTYTADDTITVAVTVQDAYGNTVDTGADSTATIDLSLSGGSAGATLGGTTSKSATAGVATFSDLTVHKVGTAYKLSAASTDLTGDDSTTFDITPGALDHFSIAAIGTQKAGTAFNVTATAYDAWGNIKTDYTGGATLTGTLSNAPDATPPSYGLFGTWADGAATASVTAYKAETGRTLTASDGTPSGTSNSFDVTHGDATKLAFTTNPASTYTADDEFTLGVTVQDAWGNTVTTGTNASASIDLALSGGNTTAFEGTHPQAASAGVATFPLTAVRIVGTDYQFTASASGLTDATSSLFDVTPGQAVSVKFVSPDTSDLVSGQTRSFSAEIRDAWTNRVTYDNSSQMFFTQTNSGLGAGSLSTSFSASGTTVTAGLGDSNTITGGSIGTITVQASVSGLNTDEISFDVVPAETTTVLSPVSPSSVQYSDQVTLTATVTPYDLGNGELISGTVTFKIVNNSNSTIHQDVSTSTISTTTGVATVTAAITLQPGSYTVTAYFVSSNPEFTDSQSSTQPLTVTQEDARAFYGGQTLFWTPNTTTTTANVTLTATIKDITALPLDGAYDAFAGNISNAKVTFINRDTNTAFAGCSNLSVSLVSGSDIKVGTVTCQTTLTAGSTSGTQYTVGIVVSGYYTRNSGDDNTVITVAQPLASNFITGGGFLVESGSAGTYASTPGMKANFGFNVKYNKGGTNLQGGVNLIVRSGGHVYQFKSNSMTSLGVTCSTTKPTTSNPCTANFVSKANLTDVTNPLAPVALGGNLILQMQLTDKGEPGSADMMSVAVYNGSTLLFSSYWNGTTTAQQLLGGGNLSVH